MYLWWQNEEGESGLTKFYEWAVGGHTPESRYPVSPVPPSRGGFKDPPPKWAVAFLVAAVTSKAAATTMNNKEAAQQIIAAADEKIAEIIDGEDICPPWPLPGPPPGLSTIASELTFIANNLQDGNLRTGILQVAGQVLDRAFRSSK
jgi:hypothetical protein